MTVASSSRSNNAYDVLIVGAGVAGCAMARALSLHKSRSIRIGVLERSLVEPNRIVGELLQPAGMMYLEKLGLSGCTEGIGAVRCTGYCVVDAREGKQVHIPYPGNHEGRSFHHGRFIQKLRESARTSRGVELIEGTVNELIECEGSGRVIGLKATTTRSGKTSETFLADLVLVADGFASNFRSKVLGLEKGDHMSVTKSHFVGAVLKGARLPIPGCGTVALIPGTGPVLMYQIDDKENETRILVDVREPQPKDMAAHIATHILPHLPTTVQPALQDALAHGGLRKMPNSFMPPRMQGSRPAAKEGVLLIGDAWNMRHPLTGGGMTVALSDVVLLSELLEKVDDLHDWDSVLDAADKWFWRRKPVAATVNVLSVALYDLFGAESAYETLCRMLTYSMTGPDLAVLRTGCFKYFELGGECVNGPVSLLAVTNPSFRVLFMHFFAVAFYSIWVLFTHPRPVRVTAEGKTILRRPRPDEWPLLLFRSVSVVRSRAMRVRSVLTFLSSSGQLS